MVIFGGVDLIDWKNDAWSLPLGNKSPWSPIFLRPTAASPRQHDRGL